MRLLHTSDWHVTEGPRLEDTLCCLDAMIAEGRAATVDAWIIAGDLHGCQVPHRATPRERNAVAARVQRMATHAPVLLVYGNHDYPGDLDIYAKLERAHPIIVADKPGWWPCGIDAVFYFLPYPSKRLLMRREHAGGLEGQKHLAEGGLHDVLAGFGRHATEQPDRCHVLIAHLNIGGSKVAGDEVLIGQEIELAPHDFDELRGMSYCALGHIHRQQQMAARAWYCGAPSMQNHGEESYEPGYLIVDIAAGAAPVVTPHRTPARRLVTVDARWTSEHGILCEVPADLAGAEVRLRLCVSERDRAAAAPNLDALAAQLTAAGVQAIRAEVRVQPTERIRTAAITTATTLADKLAAYWASLDGATPPEEQRARCLALLPDLEAGEP